MNPSVPVTPFDRDAWDSLSTSPLSWAQERLWLSDHLGLSTEGDHRLIRIRIDGPLDESALRTAAGIVMGRHPVLAARFDRTDGVVTQSTVERDLDIGRVDLSAVGDVERGKMLDALIRAEASARFDLAQGPLLRGTLVRTGETTHELLVALHAIAADETSCALLAEELGLAYEAAKAGRRDALPPAPPSYLQAAAWQRDWLTEAGLDDDTAWWKAHLDGAPALLELPLDRSRPLVHPGARAAVTRDLGEGLGSDLRAFASRHGVLPEVVLTAAWAALMSRLSRQDDVVVGISVSGRDDDSLRRTIGPFANTLALRVTQAEGESVSGNVRRVATTWSNAHARRQAPLERVVEQVRPRLASGHHPLFQTILCFAYQTSTRSDTWHPGTHDAVPPRMDLALCLDMRDSSFAVRLRYAETLFDAASADRVLDQWRMLLTGMLADDTGEVARLPLMTDGARAALLGLGHAQSLARDAVPMHRMFESHAKATPDAPAITFEGNTLTYGELNRRANRLAHRLLAEGVRPEDLVAICVERGFHTIVAILGVLKSGGAYVPLDAGYPADRVAYMIEDSAARVLVTERACQSLVASPGLVMVSIDDDETLGAQPDTDPTIVGLDATRLAYVIYTSGSTGQPKGVLVEHRQVHRLMASTDPDFGFDASDVWTVFHSYAFDFSVWEIWGALAYGGRLVMVSADCARSPRDFHALVRSEGVTVLNQTPGAFRRFIEVQAEEGGEHQLRYIVFGGEALELHSLKPWIARNDPQRTRLVNMYGITETTVHATWRPLDAETIHSGRGSLIGKPLRDLRIYVLDAQRQPVPPGVTGEMYVAGAGVARGYLRRDALTAERFLDNPFDAAHPRMYKSGDLARWTASGELEYLGRNDFQVKIRGFRIELNEIEARLIACPGVRAATVIAREDRPGDKRLVAYLLAEDGARLVTADLRRQLLRDLADYMLPSAFVVLPAYPLTANGKLDRERLPAPNRSAVVTRDYVAPVDDVETVIVDTWKKVLELESIGRDDHFFELGGNSVLAMPMVYGLGKHFGIEIPLRVLFAHPTVSALADVVRGDTSASPFPNLAVVRAEGGRRPLFVIHAGLGEIGYAYTLADWIDRDIPMYGFAARGLIEGEVPLTSVPEMAALYIEGMRHLQPKGPYRVIGWSAGGSISHEIACQLEATGEEVEFVGLIDTPREYDFPFEVAADGSNREEALAFDAAASIMGMLPTTLPEPIVAGMRELASRGDHDSMLDRMRAAGFIPKGVDNALAVRHLAYRHSMDVALFDYRPGTLRARVTLFSAYGESRWDESLGWSDVLPKGQLRVVSIQGNHCSLMNEPQINRLGDAIVDALDEAEATARHRNAARMGEPA